MSDIEASQTKESKTSKNKINLLLKTNLHFIYLMVNIVVSLYALTLTGSITEEMAKEIPLSNIQKYFLGFGTNWNYMFQTIFLFLALAHDVLEWASKQESAIANKIRYCRDVLFTSLVAPFTCFVFTIFWTVYAIDRELIFPSIYDTVIPWWFNQCVHTNIMVLLVAETFLQPRRQPANHKLELRLNAFVSVFYAVVYYSIYFIAGRWLYKVFGIMTWWQVCLFQTLIWSSSYFFYTIQFPINRLIHGPVPEPEEKISSSPELTLQNGVTDVKGQSNGEATNGDVTKNGVEKNGVTNNVDFQTPPFSTKSWSLKYRSLRNQFEKTKL